MVCPRTILIGVILVATASTAVAGWHRTRPVRREGIPARDYQYRSRSESVTGRSTLASNYESQGEPTGKREKIFRLDRTLIQGHCAVSELAVVMTNEGDWILSLRADQNPANDPSAPKIEAGDEAASHILRNEFHVSVRGYRTDRLPRESQDGVGPGNPMVLELPEQEFWVQRGQPERLRRTGASSDITRHFQEIDQIEVEFFFYK